MAIYSAGIAAAASLGGGFLAASSAKKLQDDAQRWNRKMYAKRYQMTVKDMLAAGLNPILAAPGAGGGAGSVPGSPMADGIDPNIGSRAVSSAMDVYLGRTRALAERDALVAKAQRDASERDYLSAQTISETYRQPGITPTIEANLAKMRSEITANSARAYRDTVEPSRVSGWGFSLNPDAILQRLNSAAGLGR